MCPYWTPNWAIVHKNSGTKEESRENFAAVNLMKNGHQGSNVSTIVVKMPPKKKLGWIQTMSQVRSSGS